MAWTQSDTLTPQIIQCRTCGQGKPISDYFPSSEKRKDWRCRECFGVRNREWRSKNRERNNANERARLHRIPVNVKQERHRNYYLTHKDQVAEKNRRWAENNREQYAAYQSEWNRTHREIRRHQYIARKYGISQKQMVDMLAAQDGRCAICGRTDNFDRRNFAVDHCHLTGAVRGLLCTKCNVAVGLLEDSPELLEKAAAYLSRRGL